MAFTAKTQLLEH